MALKAMTKANLMNREEINSHLPSNADMTTLNEIESYLDSAKSNEDRQEIIKNIAKQHGDRPTCK